MFLFHPTASSAYLSDFPEFWLKVYLQIFVEQVGNALVLRIFRGCRVNPVVETNQPHQSRGNPYGAYGTVES